MIPLVSVYERNVPERCSRVTEIALRVTGHGRLFESVEPARKMLAVKRRGKLIAFSTSAIGLVVLATVAWVAKERILEEWWLWRFENGRGEERWGAGRSLVQNGSIVGVLAVCRQIEKAIEADPDDGRGEAGDLASLIVSSHELAFPQLRFLEEGGDSGREIYMVRGIGDVVYVLRIVTESREFPDEVRSVCTRTLTKLQSH